jgi:hypothetical protein
VIVTRFEKGIAYVRRWDEMSGDPLNLGSRDVTTRDRNEP